jgi:hypothetical protein
VSKYLTPKAFWLEVGQAHLRGFWRMKNIGVLRYRGLASGEALVGDVGHSDGAKKIYN